jgi:hypothetical protein
MYLRLQLGLGQIRLLVEKGSGEQELRDTCPTPRPQPQGLGFPTRHAPMAGGYLIVLRYFNDVRVLEGTSANIQYKGSGWATVTIKYSIPYSTIL